MTNQAGKVGRGLRSIGANIANLASSAGELSFQVNGATETISLLDEETGDMLSTRAVLEEISKSWENMTNEEKAALAIQLSGKTQIDVFTSVLSNFDTVLKASEMSMNSLGSAEKENEKVMESLTAKINQMKTQFESLVLGTDAQNLLKSLADIVTNVLKVINTLGGLRTILVAIGGIILTLNINKITLGISSLIGTLSKLKDGVVTFFKSLSDIKGILGTVKGSLGQYGAAMQVATMNTEGLALAEEAVAAEGAAAASAIQGIVGVASLLIVGIMAVVSATKQQREEQERVRKETIENLSNEISAMDDLLEQLKDESISKEQLASLLSGTLSDAYIEELNAINDTNAAREKAIELVEKEAKAKADELLKTGLTDYQEAGKTLYGGMSYNPVLESFYDPYSGERDSDTDFLGSLGDFKSENYNFSSLYEYRDWLADVIDKYHEEMFALDENSKEYKQLQDRLSNIQQAYSNVTSEIDTAEVTVTEFNQALELLGKTKDYDVVKTEAEKDAEEEALESIAAGYGITVEQARELQQAVKENGTTWEEEAEKAGYAIQAISGTAEATEEAVSAFDDAMSSIQGVSDAYDTLNSAIEEYNSTGAFSLSTLEDLLSLSDSYLSALQFENGQLSLNEASMQAIANARIDEAEAQAVQQAQAELSEIATNGFSTSLIQSQSASAIAQNAAKAASQAILASGQNAIVAAANWATAWSTITNGVANFNNVSAADAKKVEDSLKTRLATLESLRGSIGSYTTATKSSTSATKDNTSATDENTEALKKQKEAQEDVVDSLEDEIDKYEKVIKYIQTKIKDEIDALKDARDAEIDKIEEEIDAIEKEKDTVEEYWDAQIEKLQEANDELEKNIEYEQLQESLAKARSQRMKVYEDGKFVWAEDTNAISQAQDAINEFNREQDYQAELSALEQKKNDELAIYDATIAKKEAYAQEVEDNYNKQIQDLENYLNQFNSQVEEYENEQNRLLALQLTGIDFENDNWKTRLKNLSSFTKSYKNKLKELEKEQETLNKLSKALEEAESKVSSSGGGSSSGSSGGSGGSSSKDSNPTVTKPYTVFQILGTFATSGQASSQIMPLGGNGVTKYNNKYVVYKKIGTYDSSAKASAKAGALTASSLGKEKYGFKQFATGTASIDSDQIALVGEDPNKELVIGSDINNGVMMKLAKGVGVVNAKSTSTLAGMLNSIMPNSPKQQASVGNNVTQTFNFDSIVLPNVTNGETFVNDLTTKFSQFVRQYKLNN